MKKNNKGVFAVCLAVLAGICLLCLRQRQHQPLSRSEFLMDTICTVTLYDWEGDGNAALDAAISECRRCDALFSISVSGSDVAKINNSHGKPVEVTEETSELLSRSLEYCRRSNGAFDITIYPVKRLWHFGGEEALPDSGELADAAERVDYRLLKLEGRTVTLPDEMGIDLGAVAKGYAADCVGNCLRKCGVNSAVIDLGGNILVIGGRPDGTAWRVGIREPFGEGNIDVKEVRDASVVTSGVYQRYFEKDGRLYHHLLDARTGMPCDTGLYAVTVIGGSSEQCDALATVCMLLGYERSRELLKDYPDTEAVFVTEEKALLYYP